MAITMMDKPVLDELTENDTLVAVMEDGRIRRIKVSDVGIWQQFLNLSGITDAWVDEEGCLILELDAEYNPVTLTVNSFVSTSVEFEDFDIDAGEITLQAQAMSSTDTVTAAMDISGLYYSLGTYNIPVEGEMPCEVTVKNITMEVSAS